MSPALLRVPASSANLGPGFDTLGLALDLYLDCRITPAATLTIEAHGCDAGAIDCTPANLIWATASTIASNSGRTLPPVHLAIDNAIPLGKGLGSSAAALTAGVVMADHLLQLGWSRRRILDEAARLEGHPDNVAACVLGGIVASGLDQSGAAHAVRLSLPPSIGIAVVVPDFALPTHEARAVLPDCYSREDAIFNIQRTALLLAAQTACTSPFARRSCPGWPRCWRCACRACWAARSAARGPRYWCSITADSRMCRGKSPHSFRAKCGCARWPSRATRCAP